MPPSKPQSLAQRSALLLAGASISYLSFPDYTKSQTADDIFSEVFGGAAPTQQFMKVPLYINGNSRGSITAKAAPSGVLVQSNELRKILRDYIEPKALLSLVDKADEQGFLHVGELKRSGIGLVYDESLLAIVSDFAPEARKTGDLHVRQISGSYDKMPLRASDLTAYMNLRTNVDYVKDGTRGFDPVAIDSNLAVNYKKFVLEADWDYLEDASREFRRGNIRLVYDFPEHIMRTAVGDLSYPVTGFQSFIPMAGASLAKNYDLQPYVVTEPTGRTSFFLKEDSNVEVYVNNVRVQSYRLDAGNYDLSDFPLANGINDVKLVITDIFGNIEVKRLSLFTDNRLLSKGLHEYAYNWGVVADEEDRKIDYDENLITFSGFHRYGVTENLTLGLNLQGNEEKQLTGIDIASANKFGVFSYDLAYSHNKQEEGDVASRLSYLFRNYTDPKYRTVNITAEYRGDDFLTPASNTANNEFAWQFSGKYSQKLPKDFYMSFGGNYDFGRSTQGDEWGLSFTLNKSFKKGLSMNFTANYDNQDQFNVLLNFSYSIPDSRHVFGTDFDSAANSGSLSYSYQPAASVNSVSGNAELNVVEDEYQVTGGVNYNHHRIELRAKHNYLDALDGSRSSEQRTSLSAATAIVYANGKVAFSRPIHDSFVMVTRDKPLRDRDIYVNANYEESGKRYYQTKLDKFGPGVLPNATSYLYKNVTIDHRTLPAFMSIGDYEYVVKPTYKSGTVIHLGAEGYIQALGKVRDMQGNPIGLAAGSVIALDNKDMEEKMLFTSPSGQFTLESMNPGKYELRLYKYNQQPIHFEIADGAEEFVRLGDLILPDYQLKRGERTTIE